MGSLALGIAVALSSVQGAQARQARFIATAYSVGCGGGYTTASGATVADDIIAVDPRVLRMHRPVWIRTTYYFKGAKRVINRRFRPEDTGGDIIGRRIDIWMHSCAEAIAFGRRDVLVTY
jgi:3D (Asp-Asp-Asp) domain-containing protein